MADNPMTLDALEAAIPDGVDVDKAAVRALHHLFSLFATRIDAKVLSGPAATRPAATGDTRVFIETDGSRRIWFSPGDAWQEVTSGGGVALATFDAHVAARNPHQTTAADVGAAPAAAGVPPGGTVGQFLGRVGTELLGWADAGKGPYRGATLFLSGTQLIPPSTAATVAWGRATGDTEGFWSASAPTQIRIPSGSGILKVRITLSARWIYSHTNQGTRHLKTQRDGADYGERTELLTQAAASSALSATGPVFAVTENQAFTVYAFHNQTDGNNGDGMGLVADGTYLHIEVVETVDGKVGGGGGLVASHWLPGDVAPTAALGKDRDLYLNRTTGDVYERAAGTWTLTGNIRGPQGLPGPAGPEGPKGDPGAIEGLPTGGNDGDALLRVLPDGATWGPAGGLPDATGHALGDAIRLVDDGAGGLVADWVSPAPVAPAINKGLSVVVSGGLTWGQARAEYEAGNSVGIGARGVVDVPSTLSLPTYMPGWREYVIEGVGPTRAVLRMTGSNAMILRKDRRRSQWNDAYTGTLTRGQRQFSGLGMGSLSGIDPKMNGGTAYWLRLKSNGPMAYGDGGEFISRIDRVSGDTIWTEDEAWFGAALERAEIVTPLRNLRMAGIRFQGHGPGSTTGHGNTHLAWLTGLDNPIVEDCEFVLDDEMQSIRAIDAIYLDWVIGGHTRNNYVGDSYDQSMGYGIAWTGSHHTISDNYVKMCKHCISFRGSSMVGYGNKILDNKIHGSQITAIDTHEGSAGTEIARNHISGLGHTRGGVAQIWYGTVAGIQTAGDRDSVVGNTIIGQWGPTGQVQTGSEVGANPTQLCGWLALGGSDVYVADNRGSSLTTMMNYSQGQSFSNSTRTGWIGRNYAFRGTQPFTGSNGSATYTFEPGSQRGVWVVT